MRKLIIAAIAGLALSVSGARAGTYDATAQSLVYGPGWSGEGIATGYATAPLTLSAALSTSTSQMFEVHFKVSAKPSAISVLLGSTTFGWMGVSTDGFIEFRNNGSSSSQLDITGTTSVADGEWHVATMVIGGGYMVGYLDGVQVGYKSGAITIPATSQLGIGAMETGANASNFPIDEASFWKTQAYLQQFTPLSVPYQGVENGLTALYHLNGNITDSAETPVSADLSGTTTYFSPYNWASPDAGSKVSINAGAYFKTSFSGSQCSLSFDTDSITALPVSEVSVSVDGMAPTIYNVSGVVPCSPSALVDIPVHSLRVAVKSTSETQTRWATLPLNRVALTSINIAPGSSFYAPKVLPKTLLFYGDSITEGVRTLGETQTYDTDRNDNSVEWSAQVANRLNAEYGIVGFGATGLTKSGSGSVPALTSSWNLIYPGQERSFATCPDAMIENEGTNDGDATAAAVQAAETTFLEAFTSMCPATKSIVMRPFDGQQWDALQAAVSAMGSRNISLLDTTGFMNTAMGIDSLGLHPTANNAINFLAPQVATSVSKILEAPHSQTYTFN